MSLLTGLIGAWPATEGTGSTAADISGGGRNCTLAGTATWGSWANGPSAMVFDGSAGCYASVPTNAAFDTVATSIVIWMQTTTSAGGSSAHIFGRHSASASNSGTQLIERGSTSNRVGFAVKNAGFTCVDLAPSTGTILNDGNPHCLIATVASQTAGAAVGLYVDGASAATGACSLSWSYSADAIRWAISLDSFWAKYTGKIGPTYWYDRVLSGAEITALSANPYAVQAALAGSGGAALLPAM